jgi:hypothetical protein
MESNCRVRRQSIARRINGHSKRAARQRQRPGYSQYRYGFRPTLSLRISLAMRHGGGLAFNRRLNMQSYNNDGRNFPCCSQTKKPQQIGAGAKLGRRGLQSPFGMQRGQPF